MSRRLHTARRVEPMIARFRPLVPINTIPGSKIGTGHTAVRSPLDMPPRGGL